MEKFWFFDTRQEDSKPFGITSKDVAKTWKNEHATGNGPFKAVEAPEASENQKDAEPEENDENGGNEENTSVYDDMSKEELKGELEAREITFKSKATNKEMIALLVEDDNQGGV